VSVSAAQDHTPATIAVLEDDHATAELPITRLEHHGYLMHTFAHSDAWCAFIRARRPDLTIFGGLGGAVNGLDVLETLTHEFGASTPPVIVATALRNYHIHDHPVVRQLRHARNLYNPCDILEMLAATAALMTATAIP
jgi:DNA-binding response OmpR family regulator